MQEGNGLNQGLFGPVDLASTLASLLAQRGSEGRGGGWEGGEGMVRMEEVLGERRMLAEALTELMVEDSLRRAVSEVRICVCVCVCTLYQHRMHDVTLCTCTHTHTRRCSSRKADKQIESPCGSPRGSCVLAQLKTHMESVCQPPVHLTGRLGYVHVLS